MSFSSSLFFVHLNTPLAPQTLRKQVMKFSSELLDQTRTKTELAIMLNYDPDGDVWNEGEVNSLARLKMAIKFSQKSVGGAEGGKRKGGKGEEGRKWRHAWMVRKVEEEG